MTKLSYGDLGVNEKSFYGNKSMERGSFGLEQMNQNEKNFLTPEKIKKDPSINNAIVVNKGSDNSIKYTFDNIYEDKELISVAKDYYANRDKEVYDNKTAVDKFISDRTWNQANTMAMGAEFKYITGDNVTEDQKARLAYLTRYWDVTA